MIRRFALAIAAAATLVATSAVAADYYPARDRAAMDKLFVASAPYNWTGFYAGGTVGYGFGSADSANVDTGFGAVGVGSKISGATVGGTIGYNYQIGNVVVGLEGDWSLANMKGNGSTDFLAWGFWPVTASTNNRIDWFGTARGRLGYAFDRFMPYVTGGYAFGGGTVSAATSFFGSPIGSGNQSVRLHGWALGGGVEYAINRNWSAKVEYLHMDLGSAETTIQVFGTPTAINTRFKNDLVRVGLNYKF